MVSKPNHYTRRILTSPAVRPCDAVSPATLLDSLITLSRSICSHKSNSFSTNKRNIRQTIRMIQILLNFLEEFRERGLTLSDSAAVSLSELHFIFQKVRFLLEDCARDGARLLVLMKSELVSGQLRVLIRSISTALDVLSLDSIEISIEIKEGMQLVMKQARNSKFKTDPDDESVCKDVVSILGRFENRIVPEPIDLKRVCDQLGIRSWFECNREVKFLEAEIGLEYLTTEKRDFSLLSSLMVLLCYCRSVLFDTVDNHSVASKQSHQVISSLNEEDFKCPISLEFMSDPVTLSTGHTYDRSSISKWFKSGNLTCPKTGERLLNRDLVPNLALKILISQHCSDNGIRVADHGGPKRDITRTVAAGSAAAEEAMKMVSSFLAWRLEFGSYEERKKAAYEIRLLTKTSIFSRSCLVDANTIPYLLNLLCSSDSLAQENAMAALLNLSKHSKSKRIIVENGGVGLILGVLKEGPKMEAQHHAAGTLFYLASVDEIPEAIPALMEMLRSGSSDRGKKNSLVAIFGLLVHPKNHLRAISAGLVPLLVNLLPNFEREDLVTDSLAILATLAEKSRGTMAILKTGALDKIIEVFGSTSSRGSTEFCVALLLALCVHGGEDVVSLLAKNPSLMGPLYSLLAQGTSRGSKKAGSLIRILHQFHEKSPSGFMNSAAQYVHVW